MHVISSMAAVMTASMIGGAIAADCKKCLAVGGKWNADEWAHCPSMIRSGHCKISKRAYATYSSTNPQEITKTITETITATQSATCPSVTTSCTHWTIHPYSKVEETPSHSISMVGYPHLTMAEGISSTSSTPQDKTTAVSSMHPIGYPPYSQAASSGSVSKPVTDTESYSMRPVSSHTVYQDSKQAPHPSQSMASHPSQNMASHPSQSGALYPHVSSPAMPTTVWHPYGNATTSVPAKNYMPTSSSSEKGHPTEAKATTPAYKTWAKPTQSAVTNAGTKQKVSFAIIALAAGVLL